MKTMTLFIFMTAIVLNVQAQDARKDAMQKRAREMYQTISVDDKDQWEKFVKENYSATLIDKPMRAKISTAVDGKESQSEEKSASNLHEKAMLFQQLYNDFGKSKIESMIPNDDGLEMVLLSTSGLKGVFNLIFGKQSPYLIDGLKIEVH